VNRTEVGDKERSRKPERRVRAKGEMRNRVGGSVFWEGQIFFVAESIVCLLIGEGSQKRGIVGLFV
jgi:hypothetical protein